MSPARGEVWLYERPDRKPRPVLVLVRNEAVGVLNRVLVVPLTHRITVLGAAKMAAVCRALTRASGC